jgi:PleD family two-component response regulator
VKSILDAHGAAIHVESEEGKGTVSTSGCRCWSGRKASRSRRRRASAATRGLVLVVDDDDELTRRVSADLTQEGLSVIATASASEGAALAAARRPDVIVLDLLLPDRGGSTSWPPSSATRPRGTFRC